MTVLKDIEESKERIVHAKYDGVEVVRYDNEWFLESIPLLYRSSLGTNLPSLKKEETQPAEQTKVSLKEAAQAAAKGVREAWEPSKRVTGGGFQVFFGQVGGTEFDEIVKGICPVLCPEIQYVQLDDDHEFMAMRCPGGCGDWLRIGNRQLEGNYCTDHQRDEGGCGFHGYIIGPNAGYVTDLGDVLNKVEKKK